MLTGVGMALPWLPCSHGLYGLGAWSHVCGCCLQYGKHVSGVMVVRVGRLRARCIELSIRAPLQSPPQCLVLGGQS